MSAGRGASTRISWWWVVFIVGLVGGSIIDPTPARKPVYRADYRVLQADLHTHTRFGDGFLTPIELVLAARRHALDVVAVTEHSQTFPGKIASWFSSLIDGPTIIVGQEITTRAHHLIALGVKETVGWHQSLSDVIDDVHRQGALVVAAHPARHYWPAFDRVAHKIDGTEIGHPAYFVSPPGPKWTWDGMLEFYRRLSKNNPTVAAIGSSDYHFGKALGAFRTLVFVREESSKGVLDAIRAGRTVVEMPGGQRLGNPVLIEALERDPLSPYAEPTYRPLGHWDTFFRCAGWLGLIGLLLLRRPYFEVGGRPSLARRGHDHATQPSESDHPKRAHALGGDDQPPAKT